MIVAELIEKLKFMKQDSQVLLKMELDSEESNFRVGAKLKTVEAKFANTFELQHMNWDLTVSATSDFSDVYTTDNVVVEPVVVLDWWERE